MCWEMCRANPPLSRWSLRWSLFADGYVADCVCVYFELLVNRHLIEGVNQSHPTRGRGNRLESQQRWLATSYRPTCARPGLGTWYRLESPQPQATEAECIQDEMPESYRVRGLGVGCASSPTPNARWSECESAGQGNVKRKLVGNEASQVTGVS